MRFPLFSALALWLISSSALAAAPSEAQDFRLGLPIGCTLGKECFIQNYVDVDSEGGEQYRDYQCGKLSYPAHKGTDFALQNFADTARHVPVIASAAGTVQGTRDGEEDGLYLTPKKDSITRKECGNGVRLVHAGGWSTQYCHLLKGSVKAKKGQIVQQGDLLGYVGMSGAAEFPHVHLQVEYKGRAVDPFVGTEMDSFHCGSANRHSLWQQEPTYTPTGIVQAGFSDKMQDYANVQKGLPAPGITTSSDRLIFWVELYGVQPKDVVHMQLLSPSNDVLVYDKREYDRKKARAFQLIGRKFETTRMAQGSYKAQMILMRNKKPVLDQRWSVEVK